MHQRVRLSKTIKIVICGMKSDPNVFHLSVMFLTLLVSIVKVLNKVLLLISKVAAPN